MHGPINVKSPNNISEWQMGFNSAFKGLREKSACCWSVLSKYITMHSLQNVKKKKLYSFCNIW